MDDAKKLAAKINGTAKNFNSCYFRFCGQWVVETNNFDLADDVMWDPEIEILSVDVPF